MAYLGSWKIDDLLTFPANTHRFDTGVATDADSVPSYRVYEDETATPILTGTMALLDSTNTAGFYSEQLTLSAANGFEKGKSYTIYISATVNLIEGTISHTFQMEAEVDANSVSGNLGTSAGVMLTGTVDNATFTPTTTEFEADDITEATADHFIGRVIIWTSGALLYQARRIDGYVLANSKGKFTVAALTEAPTNNDTFIIV